MPHIEPMTPPHALPNPGDLTNLRLALTACFLMQAAGCVHGTAEQAPAPTKPSNVGKQAAPASAVSAPPGGPPQQPAHAEQFEKAKTAERKLPAIKEKKSDKKSEQSQESNTDEFIPPPPLKPPTFGGAGG